jgi:starch synthase
MKEALRVAFVTPEISPFAKSGKVADFAAVLPKFLFAAGVGISLVVPRYRTPEVDLLEPISIPPDLAVPMGADKVKASVFGAERGGYRIFFIDHPRYFLRDQIYGPANGEYLDNDERFIFFDRAALELLRRMDPPVDIIHCHDWPAALVPVFLQTHYREEASFQRTASVLTIHNASDQGEFPPESLSWTGLNWDIFNRPKLALNGRFNFLKAGIAHSDVVSVTNAAQERALLDPKHSHGLSELLRNRGASFIRVGGGENLGSWEDVAREYIELYERALLAKRGGRSGG